MRLRIGFLGDGNLARAVRARIEAERPYDVAGVAGRAHPVPEDVDLIVETATQQAVRERVPGVIAAGVDVLLLSIGALADADLRASLQAGPGRLILSTGAIGGLDQVRALRIPGPLTAASIETRKLPATLAQPWMDVDLRATLDRGHEEVVLAEGSAAEIASQFPASANVAAALAMAGDAWDIVRASVVADPTATLTRHVIRATGPEGSVEVSVENEPSAQRPRSSAIVASAILLGIDDYARLRGFDAPDGDAFL